MSSRSAALVVALLLVLAGCAGSDGGPAPTTTSATPATNASTSDSQTETTAANTTAATSTTANDSSVNASLPPGVNATSVEDSGALVGAHRRALENTSFAFRFRANVSVGPASQWTLQHGTVGEGLSPLVVHSNSVRRIDDGTSSVATDLWANGTEVVVQYHGENRTELRRYNRSGENVADETWAHLPRADLGSQVTQAWLLELALTTGEYERVRTEGGDVRNASGENRTMTVLRATEPVAAANYTDLQSTLRVDSTGRVHSLSLTASYEGHNETRIHYEFELTEIGDASVDRPRWVGAATPPTTRENTTTAEGETATTTSNAQYATTTTTEA